MCGKHYFREDNTLFLGKDKGELTDLKSNIKSKMGQVSFMFNLIFTLIKIIISQIFFNFRYFVL